MQNFVQERWLLSSTQATGVALRKTSNEDQEVGHRRQELNTNVKAQCKVWQLLGQPGGWQNSSNNFIPARRKSALAGSGYFSEAYLTQAVRHAQDLDRRKGRQCHQKDQSILAKDVWLKVQGLCLWQWGDKTHWAGTSTSNYKTLRSEGKNEGGVLESYSQRGGREL